jgi:hypothetical protein
MKADDAPKQPDEYRINWSRAVFVGAIAGGVLWSLVIRVATGIDGATPMSMRLVYAIAMVCLPVGLLGIWMYRGSADVPSRTIAVATLIAPATGLFLLLTLAAPGLLPELFGR